MRLCRTLSVGRKPAASVILAILLLGGLVLRVPRELAAASLLHAASLRGRAGKFLVQGRRG